MNLTWLGSLERVSNSSRHSLAIGGLNPARDVYMVPWPLLLITRHNGPSVDVIDVCYI